MRRVLWALVVLALPATRAQEQQAATTTVTAAAPTTDTPAAPAAPAATPAVPTTTPTATDAAALKDSTTAYPSPTSSQVWLSTLSQAQLWRCALAAAPPLGPPPPARPSHRHSAARRLMLNWHWMNMYAMKNAGTAPTGAVVPTPAAPVGYPLPVGPLSFTTAAGTPFGPVPFVPPVARPALVEEEDEEDEEDEEEEE